MAIVKNEVTKKSLIAKQIPKQMRKQKASSVTVPSSTKKRSNSKMQSNSKKEKSLKGEKQSSNLKNKTVNSKQKVALSNTYGDQHKQKTEVVLPKENPIKKRQEITISKRVSWKKIAKKKEQLEKENSIKSNQASKKKQLFVHLLIVCFVIVGAVLMGSALYHPIETTASTSDGINCEYGEWREEEVSYCLVSPDGKYFKNDRIMYEYNEKTGMCIKKTREKTCHYKEV